MNQEKEYKILGEFKKNNQKYYLLKAQDGDVFFLKNKNGSFDYLEYEEYLQISALFKYEGILYNNENIYTVTFTSEQNKKPKKIKTCKLVWFRNKLIALTLAFLMTASIPTYLAVRTYTFDHNLGADNLSQYGVDVSELISMPIIENGKESNYSLYIVDKVDTSKIPNYSKILTLKNNIQAMEYNEFCEKLNIVDNSFSQAYELINNSALTSTHKQILLDAFKQLESKYPNMDLRMFIHNFKSIRIEYCDRCYYNSTQNLLQLYEECDDFALIHEIFHIMNNSIDQETGYMCCDIHYTFVATNADKYFNMIGLSYHEYHADAFASKITGKKMDFDNSYIFNCMIYTILNTFFFDNNSYENMSFVEYISSIKSRFNTDVFSYVLDVINDQDLLTMEDSVEYYFDPVDTIYSCCMCLADSGYSKDEARARIIAVYNKLLNNFDFFDEETISILQQESISYLDEIFGRKK